MACSLKKFLGFSLLGGALVLGPAGASAGWGGILGGGDRAGHRADGGGEAPNQGGARHGGGGDLAAGVAGALGGALGALIKGGNVGEGALDGAKAAMAQPKGNDFLQGLEAGALGGKMRAAGPKVDVDLSGLFKNGGDGNPHGAGMVNPAGHDWRGDQPTPVGSLEDRGAVTAPAKGEGPASLPPVKEPPLKMRWDLLPQSEKDALIKAGIANPDGTPTGKQPDDGSPGLYGTWQPAPPTQLAGLDAAKRYQVSVPEMPPGREYKGGSHAAEAMMAHEKLGLDAIAELGGPEVNPGAMAMPASDGHPTGAHRQGGGAAPADFSKLGPAERERAVHSALAAGQASYSSRDYKAALASAESAIQMAPRSADGYLLYANTLNKLGLHAKAEEMALKALELATDPAAKARAQNALTAALLFQGRTADALASAAQGIALAHQAGEAGLEGNAYFLKAAACQLKGDRACMIDALQRAALLDAKYYSALEAARAGKDIFDPNDKESLGLLDAPPMDIPVGGALRLLWGILSVLFAALAGLAAWAWRRAHRPAEKAGIAEAFGAKPDDGLLGGKYELGRAVPSGGRGEMWEARDLSLGRPALVLRLASSADAEEARRLASAHHPNVLDVFEVIETPKGTFLVSEHLKGRTLRQLLAAKGRLPLEEARRLLKPACEALEFSRGVGITNGSLDLSRVVLTDEGYVKVVDLSARADSAGRSDVQALAACLCELVTGEPPRPGAVPAGLAPELSGLLRDAASGAVPGPAAFGARLDRAVDAVPVG